MYVLDPPQHERTSAQLSHQPFTIKHSAHTHTPHRMTYVISVTTEAARLERALPPPHIPHRITCVGYVTTEAASLERTAHTDVSRELGGGWGWR